MGALSQAWLEGAKCATAALYYRLLWPWHDQEGPRYKNLPPANPNLLTNPHAPPYNHPCTHLCHEKSLQLRDGGKVVLLHELLDLRVALQAGGHGKAMARR